VRFLYCIVCFNVLIQLLAATVNKWCLRYKSRNISRSLHRYRPGGRLVFDVSSLTCDVCRRSPIYLESHSPVEVSTTCQRVTQLKTASVLDDDKHDQKREWERGARSLARSPRGIRIAIEPTMPDRWPRYRLKDGTILTITQLQSKMQKLHAKFHQCHMTSLVALKMLAPWVTVMVHYNKFVAFLRPRFYVETQSKASDLRVLSARRVTSILMAITNI